MRKAKTVEEFDKLLKNMPDTDKPRRGRPPKQKEESKPAKTVEKLPFGVHAMGYDAKLKKYKKVIEREDFKGIIALMTRVKELVENVADVNEVVIHVR